MLSESLLITIHAERLRRRVPWPLFAAMLRRIGGVRLPMMLDAARVNALLMEIDRTRLPARERSPDLPAWRSVGTLYVAGELALASEPADTDRWLRREFGRNAPELDTRTLARAVARLRGARGTASSRFTSHGVTPGC